MEQDLIQQLEACETESRSLIRQGNIRGLEPVMRRWEDLLSRCQSQGMDTADSHYFAMVFYQLNGALYQNVGQGRQMAESFLDGEKEAARCGELLMMSGEAGQAPERHLIMAQNCGEYLRMAAAALETENSGAAFRMACAGAQISDWLWPMLDNDAARTSAEGSLQIFSMYTACGRWKEGTDWARKAAGRFEELHRRTGEATDLCSQWKAEMAVLLQALAQEGEGAGQLAGYLEKLETLEGQLSAQGGGKTDPAFWQIQALSVMALAALGTAASLQKKKKETEAYLSACCRKAQQTFQTALRTGAGGVSDAAWQKVGNEIFNAYLSGVMIWGKYCFQEKRFQEAKEQYLEILRQLDGNPFGMQQAAQLLCRIQIYTELGQMALETGDAAGEADFYYTHAAQDAWEGVKNSQTPQMLQAAVLALLGAAEIKRQTDPAQADGYARQGLEVCGLLEKMGGDGFSPGEVQQLRREFEKSLNQKPGLLGRLFGKRKR